MRGMKSKTKEGRNVPCTVAVIGSLVGLVESVNISILFGPDWKWSVADKCALARKGSEDMAGPYNASFGLLPRPHAIPSCKS